MERHSLGYSVDLHAEEGEEGGGGGGGEGARAGGGVGVGGGACVGDGGDGEEEGDARAGTVETKTGAETCPDGDDETFGTGSTSFR